jgi:hypothetical protein
MPKNIKDNKNKPAPQPKAKHSYRVMKIEAIGEPKNGDLIFDLPYPLNGNINAVVIKPDTIADKPYVFEIYNKQSKKNEMIGIIPEKENMKTPPDDIIGHIGNFHKQVEVNVSGDYQVKITQLDERIKSVKLVLNLQ